VRMATQAPVESQVNLNGVLAVIPVVSKRSVLTFVSHVPMDLRYNPVSNLRQIKMQLVDELGEPVDMRGRALNVTIHFTMKVPNQFGSDERYTSLRTM
jgi:hypothetical protein